MYIIKNYLLRRNKSTITTATTIITIVLLLSIFSVGVELGG